MHHTRLLLPIHQPTLLVLMHRTRLLLLRKTSITANNLGMQVSPSRGMAIPNQSGKQRPILHMRHIHKRLGKTQQSVPMDPPTRSISSHQHSRRCTIHHHRRRLLPPTLPHRWQLTSQGRLRATGTLTAMLLSLMTSAWTQIALCSTGPLPTLLQQRHRGQQHLWCRHSACQAQWRRVLRQCQRRSRHGLQRIRTTLLRKVRHPPLVLLSRQRSNAFMRCTVPALNGHKRLPAPVLCPAGRLPLTRPTPTWKLGDKK